MACSSGKAWICSFSDLSGRHQPPPLFPDLGDHHGDAVVLVPGPVLDQALLAAVGDGVTLTNFTFLQLFVINLVTFETGLLVSLELWHLVPGAEVSDLAGCCL